VFQLYTAAADPEYCGVSPIPTVDDMMGLYFSGDARIERSTSPGVVRGTVVAGTGGVTMVVTGVATGNVSIGVGNGNPPGFSDVQPVNRIAIMSISPVRAMKGLMIR